MLPPFFNADENEIKTNTQFKNSSLSAQAAFHP